MAKILTQESGDTWAMFNGDCVEGMRGLPENSIHYGIHSPPFANLYIYSDSDRDMGNCSDQEEFFQHYRFAIDEMLRATMPGRLCSVHCKDLPRYANVYGTTGLIDFPGAIIQEFESSGWVYHSRVTVWKCPVIERERTNNNGLLHKTVLRDRSQLRQGMADYLLTFRKPPADGDGLLSVKPITGQGKGFDRYIGEIDPRVCKDHPSQFARKSRSSAESIDIWQRYADPVWFDINQTDVLNFRAATSEKDVKHICPLQIGLIERAVQIWSDENETVLSPFAGIGSEGVGSLRLGRRFVGFELKPEYFEHACRNLRIEEDKMRQPDLFAEVSK